MMAANPAPPRQPTHGCCRGRPCGMPAALQPCPRKLEGWRVYGSGRGYTTREAQDACATNGQAQPALELFPRKAAAQAQTLFHLTDLGVRCAAAVAALGGPERATTKRILMLMPDAAPSASRIRTYLYRTRVKERSGPKAKTPFHLTDLCARCEAAVAALGGPERATTKRILQLMPDAAPAASSIKSYLERLRTKERSGAKVTRATDTAPGMLEVTQCAPLPQGMLPFHLTDLGVRCEAAVAALGGPERATTKRILMLVPDATPAASWIKNFLARLRNRERRSAAKAEPREVGTGGLFKPMPAPVTEDGPQGHMSDLDVRCEAAVEALGGLERASTRRILKLMPDARTAASRIKSVLERMRREKERSASAEGPVPFHMTLLRARAEAAVRVLGGLERATTQRILQLMSDARPPAFRIKKFLWRLRLKKRSDAEGLLPPHMRERHPEFVTKLARAAKLVAERRADKAARVAAAEARVADAQQLSEEQQTEQAEAQALLPFHLTDLCARCKAAVTALGGPELANTSLILQLMPDAHARRSQIKNWLERLRAKERRNAGKAPKQARENKLPEARLSQVLLPFHMTDLGVRCEAAVKALGGPTHATTTLIRQLVPEAAPSASQVKDFLENLRSRERSGAEGLVPFHMTDLGVRFEAAVKVLGGPQLATTKHILQLMPEARPLASRLKNHLKRLRAKEGSGAEPTARQRAPLGLPRQPRLPAPASAPAPRVLRVEAQRLKWANPEFRKRQAAGVAEAMRRKWEDPEYRRRRKEVAAGTETVARAKPARMRAHRAEPAPMRARRADTIRLKWQDPEYRQRALAGMASAARSRPPRPRRTSPQAASSSSAAAAAAPPQPRRRRSNPARAAAIAAAMRLKWQDPDYRQRVRVSMAAADLAKQLSPDELHAAAAAAAAATAANEILAVAPDPAASAKWLSGGILGRSEATRQRWLDPDFRAATALRRAESALRRARVAEERRRRAAERAEQRAQQRRAAGEALRLRMLDPAFRKRRAAAMKSRAAQVQAAARERRRMEGMQLVVDHMLMSRRTIAGVNQALEHVRGMRDTLWDDPKQMERAAVALARAEATLWRARGRLSHLRQLLPADAYIDRSGRVRLREQPISGPTSRSASGPTSSPTSSRSGSPTSGRMGRSSATSGPLAHDGVHVKGANGESEEVDGEEDEGEEGADEEDEGEGGA